MKGISEEGELERLLPLPFGRNGNDNNSKKTGGVLATSFTFVGVLLVMLASFHSWTLNKLDDTTEITLTSTLTHLDTTYDVVNIEEEEEREDDINDSLYDVEEEGTIVTTKSAFRVPAPVPALSLIGRKSTPALLLNLKPSTVIQFKNGTRVYKSHETGEVLTQENLLHLDENGYNLSPGLNPANFNQTKENDPFLFLGFGLTTSIKEGRNTGLLIVDVELPTLPNQVELQEKLGEGNKWRYEFWMPAAQPWELDSNYTTNSTCARTIPDNFGCPIQEFADPFYDWNNSAMILHGQKGNLNFPIAWFNYTDEPADKYTNTTGSNWLITPGIDFALEKSFGKTIYANDGDTAIGTFEPVSIDGADTYWSLKGEVRRKTPLSSSLVQDSETEVIVDNEALVTILRERLAKEGSQERLFKPNNLSLLRAEKNTWTWNLAPYNHITVEERPRTVEAIPMLFPNITKWRVIMNTNKGDKIKCTDNKGIYDPVMDWAEATQVNINGAFFGTRTSLKCYENLPCLNNVEGGDKEDNKFLNCVQAIFNLYVKEYRKNYNVSSCDDYIDGGVFSIEFVLFPHGYPEECTEKFYEENNDKDFCDRDPPFKIFSAF